MVWWWIGNILLLFVVVPLVVLLANRVVRPLRQIVDYAEDILEHGVGVTKNLDPIPALLETKRLVAETRDGAIRYGAALDRILGR